MTMLLTIVAASLAAPAVPTSSSGGAGGVSAGYLLGGENLTAISSAASTLPINRIYLAFVSPTMYYVPGSKTLEGAGFDGFADKTQKDFGFAALAASIAKLSAGGVESFLSMGGWNYNCFPALYMRYSVGGYGTSTPNYWKIQKFGGGSLSGCTEKNQWCYVCEPPSENTSLTDFAIFPEPSHSKTWIDATTYVESNAPSGSTPQWHPTMVPGGIWTDTATGQSFTVPGDGTYATKNRDPYADLVALAKDLSAAGVDLDYEEMWHADKFKEGSTATGPWTLPQTTFKYAAIVKDLQLNIAAQYPSCKVSTAAAAVGAWSGKWWGGNLKGLWYNIKQWYPGLITVLTTGGVNVMTYDLSKNEQFHECPDPTDCPLVAQVKFYMSTYKAAGIPANVGFEIGTPAYPDPSVDKSDQLPLTIPELDTIVAAGTEAGGMAFFWELYKPADHSTCQASSTDVAQAICKLVTGGAARCNGVLPGVPAPSPSPCPPGPAPSPPSPSPPSPSPPPPSPPSPAKTCHAVPGSGATDTWCDENCNHDPPNCPANMCKCTGAGTGAGVISFNKF